MHIAKTFVSLVVTGLVGCMASAERSDVPGGDPADPGANPGDWPADSPGTQAGRQAGVQAVFAHSYDTLYRIDPDTMSIDQVGPFVWPEGTDTMTDIAVDAEGRVVGISFTVIYEIDAATARCRRMAFLDRELNGLSFVRDGDDEILLGTALDGSVVRLDPFSGESTTIGNFGNDLTSSGDLVSVEGFGTVATVKSWDASSDLLATVNVRTGEATVIGETGVVDIWGLGFWSNRVFGFTGANELVVIDPETGAATIETISSIPWYGAGVTTAAPLI